MKDNAKEASQKVVSSEAFKYLFECWRLLGVYPTNSCKYSFIFITMICVSLPISMTILLFDLSEVKMILEILSINITLISCIAKYLNVVVQRNNILKVNNWLAKLDAHADSIQEQSYLRMRVRTVHKLYKFVFILFSGAGIFNGMSTVLSKGERLMYTSWYPFDWKTSRINFWAAHLHQALVVFFYLFQNTSSDTFPAAYMLVLTGHVKTLNMRVRKIGTGYEKTQEENYSELVGCIKDHQLLVQFFRTVQRVTSAAIFLQFFATGIEACITAVYVLIVKGNLFDTLYLSVYFLCVILEIFLYCYFGNELISESQRITDAIYSCNWIEQNHKFRKVLIIFMQSTQRSMTIVAGGMFIVSSSTFIAVLKSSYSLFAVLIRIT